MSEKHAENLVGRPTKYTDEVIDQVCAALADGMPIKGACVMAQIGVSTLNDWREKHPEIEERMSEARERARQTALHRIKSAGDKDWRAYAEWLRLTFASDYRGAAKIEVSASASASTGLVLTEADQKELQEARAKTLRTTQIT